MKILVLIALIVGSPAWAAKHKRSPASTYSPSREACLQLTKKSSGVMKAEIEAELQEIEARHKHSDHEDWGMEDRFASRSLGTRLDVLSEVTKTGSTVKDFDSGDFGIMSYMLKDQCLSGIPGGI
jgi:hypothetical protein